eukprot:TRINITY_DN8711_c1_g1_i1.p1 TRINITY_DN8711_c1_g1~~TRINITY_DN8711_c1_g1_i1.p1  ORF type:complete len:461 (-),score=42.35 TRINITY_DN8711_c1_g1_i1:305-1663(-)
MEAEALQNFPMFANTFGNLHSLVTLVVSLFDGTRAGILELTGRDLNWHSEAVSESKFYVDGIACKPGRIFYQRTLSFKCISDDAYSFAVPMHSRLVASSSKHLYFSSKDLIIRFNDQDGNHFQTWAGGGKKKAGFPDQVKFSNITTICASDSGCLAVLDYYGLRILDEEGVATNVDVSSRIKPAAIAWDSHLKCFLLVGKITIGKELHLCRIANGQVELLYVLKKMRYLTGQIRLATSSTDSSKMFLSVGARLYLIDRSTCLLVRQQASPRKRPRLSDVVVDNPLENKSKLASEEKFLKSEQKCGEMEADLKRKESTIAKLQASLDERNSDLVRKESTISKLQASLDQRNSELDGLAKKLNHLRGDKLGGLNAVQVSDLLKEVTTAKVKLMERKEKLEDSAGKCAICLDGEANIFVEDCRHCCLCESCSKKGVKTCPICQVTITKTVQIFRS